MAGPGFAWADEIKPDSCARNLEIQGETPAIPASAINEKVANAVASEVNSDCAKTKCGYREYKAAVEKGFRKVFGDRVTDVLFKERKISNFRIWGLFVSAILANAAVATFVDHGVNPVLSSFLKSCLTIAPFIIMQLGSSIVSKIGAVTSQWGWNNGVPVYRDQVDLETQSLLESLNRMSHENLSLLAQGGRGTLLSSLRELKADFHSILQACLINREVGFQLAPGLIALEAFALRKLYPKVDFSDPEFAQWPKRIFSNQFINETNYKATVTKVIEILSVDDPVGFADPRTRQRYLAMITAWLEPEKPAVPAPQT